MNCSNNNNNTFLYRFEDESFNEVVYNMMTLLSVFIKKEDQWDEVRDKKKFKYLSLLIN